MWLIVDGNLSADRGSREPSSSRPLRRRRLREQQEGRQITRIERMSDLSEDFIVAGFYGRPVAALQRMAESIISGEDVQMSGFLPTGPRRCQ